MLKKEDYDQLREEILEWMPEKIIDCHTHTATQYDIKEVHLPRFPLTYNILHDRILSAKLNVFDRIFPGRDIKLVGFPLPLRFEGIEPNKWNNKLMIKEMKKGLIGVMYGSKKVEDLEKTMEVAKKNRVKFHGIKFHPRMTPEKPKNEVFVVDTLKEEVLEFVDRNKFAMNLELSHGLCEEDVERLLEIDQNYSNINIILPHMTYNHFGFLIEKQDYESSLKSSNKIFVKDFKKIADTKNIHLDTAMVLDKRMIQAALEVMGEDKVLYGSDYPFCFTPKIKDYRPDEQIVAKNLRRILNGKLEEVKDLYAYDYNLYFVLKIIKLAEEALNLDIGKKVLERNAKKVFRL